MVCAGGGMQEQIVEKNTFATLVDWVELLELELAPAFQLTFVHRVRLDANS